MPHPLADKLSKISTFLTSLFDDPNISQSLENRCADYKNRLLQFKVEFDSQFDSPSERFYFDVAVRGFRIDETFFTETGKRIEAAKHLPAKKPNEVNKSFSKLDTTHSMALRAKLAHEKKQAPQKPQPRRSTGLASPDRYEIFITFHGLLQGNVTLLDKFLNTHAKVAAFLELNISLLIEAFCTYEKMDISKFLELPVTITTRGANTATDRWLNSLNLALHDVSTLLWYYKYKEWKEKEDSTEDDSGELEENVQKSSDVENTDKVYPFFATKHLAVPKMKLDCLKYSCEVLAKCFPIQRLWSVDKLIGDLWKVNRVNNRDKVKLAEFIIGLSELPECEIRDDYVREFERIGAKFNLLLPAPKPKRKAILPVLGDEAEAVPFLPGVKRKRSLESNLGTTRGAQNKKTERNSGITVGTAVAPEQVPRTRTPFIRHDSAPASYFFRPRSKMPNKPPAPPSVAEAQSQVQCSRLTPM